jgi:phage baseplate assembly protein W
MALTDNRNSVTVSMPKKYRDLPLSFLKHPGTGDVRPINDIDAVKQSVKNLILTNFGDRPFQSKIGSNVTFLLFELVSPFTTEAIRRNIETTLREQEPRVNGVIVNVFDASDSNGYVVHLNYNIVSLNINVETSFFLRRLR